jgi:pyruvate ferredoxin oxidoreductase gamma subunit
MKTASRILGSAFFIEGFEVQDAPRYGAERRGAPIFAYVRAAREPIHERGIIQHADLVVVADDTLVPVPAAGVLASCDAQTVLLINSHQPSEVWRDRLNFAGRVLILPAHEELVDRAELPYVGAACAGAAARLTGVIGLPSLELAIGEELGHLGDRVVADNRERAAQAYEMLAEQAGLVKGERALTADGWQAPDWVVLPFEQADVSAPAIHAGLTSEAMQTGLWRTMRPVVDYKRCNRCWWVCSTFCPDGAIRVDEEKYPQIDYDHCKGCLICVAQCPPHAISAVAEHEALSEEGET